jgi:hypothetical protein
MSDHNEEDVLDQGLSGSGERGMQTSGVGGSLVFASPYCFLGPARAAAAAELDIPYNR